MQKKHYFSHGILAQSQKENHRSLGSSRGSFQRCYPAYPFRYLMSATQNLQIGICKALAPAAMALR